MATPLVEFRAVEKRYGDDRRTEITASKHDLTAEDLISEEDQFALPIV